MNPHWAFAGVKEYIDSIKIIANVLLNIFLPLYHPEPSLQISLLIQQTRAREKVKAAKAKGQDLTLGKRLYKEVIQEMIDSGEIDKKGGLSIGGVSLYDATLEAKPLEHGGTAHAGKAHLVGEKGPEVFIPKETGEVIANDDTQVFSMLLAANPQLQKVSKERAMKILKAKFPEYFD